MTEEQEEEEEVTFKTAAELAVKKDIFQLKIEKRYANKGEMDMRTCVRTSAP